MVYFPTGYYSHLIGNGGGLGLNYKYNINRYFGIMVDLAYTYASFSQSYDLVNLNTYSHILDIKLALVLQYETLKNKNGLVPWLSVGFGSSLNIFGAKADTINAYYHDIDYGNGVNVNFGGGLRYNYKKFYGGIAAIYNLDILNSLDDFSGARIYFELGYRG